MSKKIAKIKSKFDNQLNRIAERRRKAKKEFNQYESDMNTYQNQTQENSDSLKKINSEREEHDISVNSIQEITKELQDKIQGKEEENILRQELLATFVEK